MNKISRIIAVILAITMALGLCSCVSITYKQSETVQETASVQESETVQDTTTEQETEAVQPAESEAQTQEEMPAASVDFSTGNPWIASNVVGAVTEDTPAYLKDDFYLYVNKDDFLDLKMEPGYSTAGTFTKREIENQKDIMALFTDGKPAESHDAFLAKALYDQFLDWDSRNALGVTPLKEMVEPIEKITSIDELNEYYLTTPVEEQLAAAFIYGGTSDLNDSSVYILAIEQSGLLLGDSAEYENLTEYGKIKKAAIDDVALYMLSRLGYSDDEAQKKLDNCYDFEKKLAPAMYTRDEEKQPDYYNKVNNHITYEELEKLQGDIPLIEICDKTGYIRKDNVILMNPEWLKTLSKEYNNDNIELIKDYLIVHGATANIQMLDKECFEKLIEVSNSISGKEGRLSDEEYAVNDVQSTLGWQVARLYCDKYFTEEDKKIVKDLCEDVKKGYEGLIAEKDFLSDATKQKAIEKLRAITINSMYPDDWSPYSYDELELKTKEEGGTYFDSCIKISKEGLRKETEKFKGPVDKGEWPVTPILVNAFYNPSNNSINILAAFCKGDLFNSDMSYEEICGSLGAVIGHEISHSIDGSGSQFDKDGNMNNWWTEEDREKFDKKINAIADYADTIYCWDGTHINGSIITGEVCADMGGISVMLHNAKSHEGFDYDKFFTQFAKLWLYMETYQSFLQGLTDEHPPYFFRVNGTLQQFDEFYECYDIKEGNKMYIAPEKRVAIW